MKQLSFCFLVVAAVGCTDFQKIFDECVDGGRCKDPEIICDAGTGLTDAGTCVPLLANGEVCDSNSVCLSGFCADGFCCNAACNGQCEVCSATPGTCTAVTGVPQGGRPACTGVGTICGGTCNGALRATCAYQSPTCIVRSCTGTMATAESTCQSGVCVTPAPVQCASGICGADACATVEQVVAGFDFTCARLSDGTVKCWGRNEQGQAGQNPNNGVNWMVPRPTQVQGLSGVTSLTAGYAHVCAAENTQTVKCWGANYYGQLGLGTTDNLPHYTPTEVSGLSFIREVISSSTAHHTCAINIGNNNVWCWGDNSNGQLGDGTVTLRSSPVPICTSGATGAGCTAISNVANIAVGRAHSCLRHFNDAIYCFGSNGSYELNDTANLGNHVNPTATGLPSTNYFTAPLALGNSTSCIIETGNTAKCFGQNTNGRLGVGFASANTTQVPLCTTIGASCSSPLGGVSMIAFGQNHACAVVSGATFRCWGLASNGQLGDGSNSNAWTSTATVTNPSITGVTSLATGGSHTCVRLGDGTIRCFGFNGSNQIGNNSSNFADVLQPISPSW
jgi:alpha-tubulin suppressor-like RCC1 family protein